MIKSIVFIFTVVSAFVAADDSSLTPCKAKFVKKGCYLDKMNNRVLPKHLKNFRNLKNDDWGKGWHKYLREITCHCVNQAKDAGYRFVGIQHFVECWSGELSPTFFDTTAKSNQGCFGWRPQYDKCDDNVDTDCVGSSGYNYIYEIVEEPQEPKTNVCEQQIPCQHGECIPQDDSYSCACDADYTGKNCEVLIDDCAGSPCVNGECIDGVNSYKCKCQPGYEGKNCEENIDDCAASPCVNGECVDGVNSYQCKCKSGYAGKNCETNIDDCAGSPCVNGKCIDGVNSYQCKCQPGYQGKSCDKNIDDCVGNKCVQGKCVDGINSYRCQCNYGYEGDSCDKEIVKPSTCSNANWWRSFDVKGWSKCAKDNLFITGFWRNSPKKNEDPIYLLEEAKCCNAMPLLSSKAGECVNEDSWWSTLDKNNKWSLCPSGYFLNGLYRNSGDKLHHIEEGRCCRPQNHPDWYGACYDENVGTAFDKRGWTSCSKSGYYITGVHRGSGADWLHNIDKFRCCQMTSQVTCSTANWATSFDNKGWSTCGKDNMFLTGFYRSGKGFLWNDDIYRLEKARCCSASSQYQGEDGRCVQRNWWKILDKKRSWAVCPAGYFLNGLYRTSGNSLHNIEEGKCCQPKNHPAKHGHCYDENIEKNFNKEGWGKCQRSGYYVTGIYRHDGDSLDDIQKLRCCKMWA